MDQRLIIKHFAPYSVIIIFDKMTRNKSFIIALFSSIFFVKVVLCLATVYFQCNNERLMNSLIMQVEIEHEDHSNENIKDVFAKEFKYTNLNVNDSFNTKQYDSFINNYIDFSNLYPINSSYTDIFTPPPEMLV